MERFLRLKKWTGAYSKRQILSSLKKDDSLSKQVDDVYKQLSVILEVPMERVEKYDYRDAQYVLNQIAREVFFAPTKRKEETEGKIPKNPKN